MSFLIVFLLYATYQPLRFSIEDPERQARYASVFAITAGAFVPLNFVAVRMAQSLRAPARARQTGGDLPGEMRSRSSSPWSAMALLFVTLWKYEMAVQERRGQLRALRRSCSATTTRPRRAAQRRPRTL